MPLKYFTLILALAYVTRNVQSTAIAVAAVPATTIAVTSVTAAGTAAAAAVPGTVLTAAVATPLVTSVAVPAIFGLTLLVPFLIPIIGTEVSNHTKQEMTYTFDCWKSVVHDMDTTPSKGIKFEDLIKDPRIRKAAVVNDPKPAFNLPQFLIQNIWNETFLIHYFELPNGKLAAHASKL